MISNTIIIIHSNTIIGCECQTLIVNMKNDPLLTKISIGQGIYQKAGKINGQSSWISSDKYHTLWFVATDEWLIGSTVNVANGLQEGNIMSFGQQGKTSCPYDVSNDVWGYTIDGTWLLADADDISIECLKGIL